MRDWLKTYPGRLYVCTGNHDWWPNPDHHLDNDAEGGWLRKARRPGLSIDGASELHLGRRFVCCPWTGKPTAPPTEPAVVLVHAPPLKTPISSDVGWESGDFEVAEAIPRLPPHSFVLSGHVHQPARWCHRIGSVWCFNPGVDFSASEPNHIVIDTDARTAECLSWGKTLQMDLRD